MKKLILLLLTVITTQTTSFGQVPVNQGVKVDGPRPITPSQSSPNIKTPTIKSGNVNYNPKSPNSNSKRFKSIALNTRNGGVWLIDENDVLRGVGFHYQNLGIATITNNSKVDNLTSDAGAVMVHSKDGLGMMRGGNADPEHVRKIQVGIPDFPMPTTTYVYRDTESTDYYWYLNEKNYIRPANSSAISSNIPPEKAAKMFTAYNRRFFMIDMDDNLLMWKPGFASWKKMGDIKAKHITTDVGLSTPLWYVGIDNMVYQLSTEEPTPTPQNAKAKSIAVFGSQLYFIGLDGYFYLRVKNNDIKVEL
jgi:hypothetical protein